MFSINFFTFVETEDGPVDVEEDNTPDEDDDDDRGQEVINYQDIQVDHNSKVTSENEGKKPGKIICNTT